jgi:hypothetical protein
VFLLRGSVGVDDSSHRASLGNRSVKREISLAPVEIMQLIVNALSHDKRIPANTRVSVLITPTAVATVTWNDPDALPPNVIPISGKRRKK